MKILLDKAKRAVIKLGTGVLTSGIGELNTERIAAICEQVVHLRQRGISVVLVSSGAVGLGMGRLGLTKRPKDLPTLQACAAVGQSLLINIWQQEFDPHGVTVAQVLLTREDLRAHHRHDNISRTVERLLAKDVVPIINENDTVSASEIQFGDNDTLSALVSSIIHADLLFILSNIPGLIDMQGSGEVVQVVETVSPEIEAMAQGTRAETSVGGMVSKLSAAKIATRAGCGVFIGSGQDPRLIEKLFAGEQLGTFFVPSRIPHKSRRRWIAIQDHTPGSILIDDGAVEAILRHGKSLLVMGITAVDGSFEAGDVVCIRNAEGTDLAHGITDVDAGDLKSVLGADRATQMQALPGLRSPVVIHRDNLVLLD